MRLNNYSHYLEPRRKETVSEPWCRFACSPDSPRCYPGLSYETPLGVRKASFDGDPKRLGQSNPLDTLFNSMSIIQSLILFIRWGVTAIIVAGIALILLRSLFNYLDVNPF